MIPIDEKQRVFLEKVKQTVERYELLSYGDSVLVGLSGGADSVALFRVLLALRRTYALEISAAHVNHGLRGETAKRDMEFVQALCEAYQVPLVTLEEDVKAYATSHGLSVEEAGREVRYRFFLKQQVNKIAVAHTKDDTAETVLMNLLKGNLPVGIPPKRDRIIRPLLNMEKEEILSYLKVIGQSYVTDETNFSKAYLRNRIRWDAIPYLREHFNQNFTNALYNTSDILWQEQNFLEETVASFLEENAVIQHGCVKVLKTGVANAHIAVARKAVRRCYYSFCEEGHISYEQINRVIALCHEGQSGRKIELPNRILAELSGDWLIFSSWQKGSPYSYTLSLGSWVDCQECGYLVCWSQTKEDCDFCYPLAASPKDTVTLRNKRNGDKIYFANQKIHKKVSDFLSEKKVPSSKRSLIPMVAVNDEIRIIAGYFWENVKESKMKPTYILMRKG